MAENAADWIGHDDPLPEPEQWQFSTHPAQPAHPLRPAYPTVYGNAFTVYLDTVPLFKAAVYSAGAIAIAIILGSWLKPSQPKEELAAEAKRRRDPACALAIMPDVSKDKSDREWKRVLPPHRYTSLRAAEADPPSLPLEEGGIEDVRGL